MVMARRDRMDMEQRQRRPRIRGEVAREFAELNPEGDQGVGDEPLIVRHNYQLPPWREVLPSGEFGPWYGPMSDQQMAELERQYAERAGGEAFWDDEEDRRTRGAPMRPEKPKRDSEEDRKAKSYLVSHGREVPPGERHIAVLFFEHCMTYSEIARRLGVSRSRVNNAITNLRLRVRRAYEW